MKDTVKRRDANAFALRLRAGNAGCAIAVDTRPKSIPNKRRKNDRKDAKATLRAGRWD
jgi:hypothetical protein